MKKSFGIFVIGNIIVMTIPLILVIALRAKISAGDIIDPRKFEKLKNKDIDLSKVNEFEFLSDKKVRPK